MVCAHCFSLPFKMKNPIFCFKHFCNAIPSPTPVERVHEMHNTQAVVFFYSVLCLFSSLLAVFRCFLYATIYIARALCGKCAKCLGKNALICDAIWKMNTLTRHGFYFYPNWNVYLELRYFPTIVMLQNQYYFNYIYIICISLNADMHFR